MSAYPASPDQTTRAADPVEPNALTQPDGEFLIAVSDAVLDLDAAQVASPDIHLGHDPADFAGFYGRHRVTLARRAARFFGDRRDIDEVVQETFLKVFLALPELETELAALRFAHRVLTNMCIDRYRSDRRRPGLLDLELVMDQLSDDLPTDPLIRAEDALVVREALAQLSPEYRAALIKREIEEKPLPQIASELDIPVEQVKHLLYRARRALRRLLVGTAVDPQVDLTVGETLELAGRRLGAAAGSTATRVLAVAVLLVATIGWVLGAAPSSHQPTSSVANPAAPLSVLKPPAAAAGPIHHANPSTRGHRKPDADSGHPVVSKSGSSSAPVTGVVRHPAGSAPVRHPAGGGSQHGHGPDKPRPGSGTPPTPVSPQVPAHFAVNGVVSSDNGHVEGETRVVQGAGQYQSSAAFVAQTAQGQFNMTQVVRFVTTSAGVDGATASLNPVVPLGDGSGAGYESDDTTVTITPVTGGYQVNLTGTAQALSGSAPASRLALTIQATYDSTLTQILNETITLAPTQGQDPPTAPNGGGGQGTTGDPSDGTQDEGSSGQPPVSSAPSDSPGLSQNAKVHARR